MTKVLLQL